MQDWARAWLHTAGPSVITDELVVHEGRIVSLTLCQEGTDLATGKPVLRPHTLIVGLYSFDGDGALVRTHRLPVVMEAANLDVVEAVGLPAPDLVVVNDEGPHLRRRAARCRLAVMPDRLARSPP